MMDWKDALSQLSGLPEGEQTEETPAQEADSTGVMTQKGALHVVVEKKGRGGKTATIVEGFEIDDDSIDEIARTLRKRLGTGGSARGGEILIQGDRREDVANILRELKFKVK
ncbi:MAG: translation initiation factor [Bacteroides sp.]|nr:translation initiation factor [Bacteroides sp.]